ncbi:MAG: PAS domain S-box protein, partial [Clostridia bacterium]|nr:PAS domain S-box protein [Clostridia bacterium]
MIKKIQNASIQFKILMFFLLMGSLLTLTFGTTFYKNTLNSALSSKEKEMVTLADITANKIERFIFERVGDVQVLAQSQIFTTPDISDEIKTNYLDNVMHAYQAYDAIYILNSTSTLQLFAGDEAYQTLPENLLSDFMVNDIFISDIIENKDGTRYLYFSAPILSTEGNLEGAVIERMNFHAIDEILESIQIGSTGYAHLEENSQHAVGQLDILRLDGTEYYIATAPVAEYPSQKIQWHVAILQHRDEVLAVKNEIERYISYIVMTSLLFFVGLSYLITRRITQPIQNLMQKTSFLMENNKLFASDVVVSDEVKTLASYFDTLLEELHFMMQQVLEKSGEAAYLKEIRNSMDTLFDHMPNGIITVSSSGQISSVNAAALEILNVSEIDLLHKNIAQDTPQHLSPFFDLIHHNLTEEYNYHNEVFRFQHQDGTSVPVVFNTLRQLDLHHHLIGIT